MRSTKIGIHVGGLQVYRSVLLHLLQVLYKWLSYLNMNKVQLQLLKPRLLVNPA